MLTSGDHGDDSSKVT